MNEITQNAFPLNLLTKDKPETQPEPEKKEKKYSLETLVFVAIMVFGLTFVSTYMYHGTYYTNALNKQAQDYKTNLTEWENAVEDLQKENNQNKITASLFFNYLKLAYDLKNADTTEKYFKSQEVFMTKYYELLYSYGYSDVNEKLTELNSCYVNLQGVKNSSGNINEAEQACAKIDNEITWTLYNKLKYGFEDVFTEPLVRDENNGI